MTCKTFDDYYAWTCDWCDSENRTLWIRVAKGDLTCGACHRTTNLPTAGVAAGEQNRPAAGFC